MYNMKQHALQERHSIKSKAALAGIGSLALLSTLGGGAVIATTPTSYKTPVKATNAVVARAEATAISYTNANYPGSGTATVIKANGSRKATKRQTESIFVKAPNGTVYYMIVRQTASMSKVVRSKAVPAARLTAMNKRVAKKASVSSHINTPRISAAQATSDATSYLTSQGVSVAGTGKTVLHNHGIADYYRVGIRLSPINTKAKRGPITHVTVDATSTTGVVTGIAGANIRYTDLKLVSPTAAEASAVSAAGGGTASHIKLIRGLWPHYIVRVTNGSKTSVVTISAVSGVVTMVS